MQQLAGALGYSGNGSASARTQAAVLVSQPSMELTDRMYSDLIDSLRYSRDSAEKRTQDAERRAQIAETRLHELHAKISRSEVSLGPTLTED